MSAATKQKSFPAMAVYIWLTDARRLTNGCALVVHIGIELGHLALVRALSEVVRLGNDIFTARNLSLFVGLLEDVDVGVVLKLHFD